MHAHCRSLGRSLLMHCVPSCCSKLLSLCCITESTKLLLDWDTCLHEKKMLGFKLRAFSEMLQYKKGNKHCHIRTRWKGVFLYETLDLSSLGHCGFDFYEKKYQVAEKSRTILVIWTSQISWQQVPHVADN